MSRYVGTKLGNYHLERLLGAGGFAEVYFGEHVYLKTPAAIKVLHTRLSDDVLEQFLTEARTIAHFEHSHIVRVLEFGIEHETPYLVMNYAPYGTMRQKYRRGTIVPLQMVVSYVQQIANALQYAHRHKVVHRDVKPENVLLGRNGEALLSDFGLAVVTSSHSEGQHGKAGTTIYMAPEQIQGKPLPASDQYALAVVVYEWLCGTPPFIGTSAEIAAQHLVTPPPALRTHMPNIPPSIEQVVLRALDKDPTRRFPDVQHFAQELQQAYTGLKALLRTLSDNHSIAPAEPAAALSETTASINIAPEQAEEPLRSHSTSPEHNDIATHTSSSELLRTPRSSLSQNRLTPITSPEPFEEKTPPSAQPASSSSHRAEILREILRTSSAQAAITQPEHTSTTTTKQPPALTQPALSADVLQQLAQEVARQLADSSTTKPAPRRLRRPFVIAGIVGIVLIAALLGGLVVTYFHTPAQVASNNKSARPPVSGAAHNPTTTPSGATQTTHTGNMAAGASSTATSATQSTATVGTIPSTTTTDAATGNTNTPATISTNNTSTTTTGNTVPTTAPVIPTPTTVIQPTTPPTTQPTPTQNVKLTVQINVPGDVTNNSDQSVTISTNKAGVTVNLQVAYSVSNGSQTVGSQTTDANGQSTLDWRVHTSKGGTNTVTATLTATATDSTGQSVNTTAQVHISR